MPSSVTGRLPNTFVKRMRIRGDHSPGRTMRRNVWSTETLLGNGKVRSGCATALPLGYGPCGEAAHDITKLVAAAAPTDIAAASTTTMASKPWVQRKARARMKPMRFIVDLLQLECTQGARDPRF